MKIRIGINGFGRIGRLVARIAASAPDVDLVAFNDLVDPAINAHLFKYDSTYRTFAGSIELQGEELLVNGDKVRLLKEKDPALIPWGDLGVEFVLESTGVFTNAEACGKHLAGGAKYVILSAPAKGEMPTYLMGVNHTQWVADGKPAVQHGVKVRWTFDERINDGFYCATSLRLVREVFDDPNRLLGEPATAAAARA